MSDSIANLLLENLRPRPGRGSWHGGPTAAGTRWTLGEMILGIAQHDAYHTGQIQLLKRLWAAKRR